MKHDNEQGRSGARASMRREFMDLFRDTARERTASVGAAVAGAAPIPGPSPFLRRFLQRSAPSAEAAPSGLAGLDARLGGGFACGLHLVAGPPGAGKTAFLESLAWEAVAGRRPVLYYVLEMGSLRVWERLIATLAAVMEEPEVVPAALRGRELSPAERHTLTRLDGILQVSVLPHLSLVDAATSWAGDLQAFVDEVRTRGAEVAERQGRLPLVLIDDLDTLVTLTGIRSPVEVLSRLDAALAADSLTGVLAAGSDDMPAGEVRPLPLRTLVTLGPVPGAPPGHVEGELRKNATGGWTGKLHLLLDPSSGLFSEPETA